MKYSTKYGGRNKCRIERIIGKSKYYTRLANSAVAYKKQLEKQVKVFLCGHSLVKKSVFPWRCVTVLFMAEEKGVVTKLP